jgi:hypothetical protein
MPVVVPSVWTHARKQGMDHRRARRLLMAAERRSGKQLGMRIGRVWRVAEEEIRRYCPEFYGCVHNPLSSLEKATREHLRAVDAKIEECAEAVVARWLAAERELREAGDMQIAELVKRQAVDINSLKRAVSRIETEIGNQTLDGSSHGVGAGEMERRS